MRDKPLTHNYCQRGSLWSVHRYRLSDHFLPNNGFNKVQSLDGAWALQAYELFRPLDQVTGDVLDSGLLVGRYDLLIG